MGRRLLLLAEDGARRLCLPEVTPYTNAAMTENLSYYARRRYRETHRAVHEGFDRVFFVKHLPP